MTSQELRDYFELHGEWPPEVLDAHMAEYGKPFPRSIGRMVTKVNHDTGVVTIDDGPIDWVTPMAPVEWVSNNTESLYVDTGPPRWVITSLPPPDPCFACYTAEYGMRHSCGGGK